MRIAILRCENLPRFVTWEVPDIDVYFEDDRILQAAFEKRGVEAQQVVWSDQAIPWGDFDAAIVRSTWDYIDRKEEFLRVLDRIEAEGCRVVNATEVIRWNIHKSYFFDLSNWGIPVVPTLRVSDYQADILDTVCTEKGWHEMILKPAVGGGGSGVFRTDPRNVANTLSESGHSDYLIQPLIPSIRTEGEWSFVFAGDTPLYTLLKQPAPGDYRTHGIYGGTLRLADPRQRDLQQAASVLKKLPFAPAYARIDMVRMDHTLVVMEIELIEPVLYFHLAPDNIHLFAKVILEKLQGESTPNSARATPGSAAKGSLDFSG